jgi:hypothetical protein
MGLDRVVRVLVVAAALVSTSACGDPDVVNTPGRPVSGPLSGPAGVDAPNPTEEWPPPSMGADTEVCPSEANEPSYDEVVALGKADEQGALRDDVRILSEYGLAHPETFSSIRYGWNSAGDALMIIALTGDESIAAELYERYGDVLDIRVGAMPYPLPDGGAASEACGTVPEPPADQAGLAISLDALTADPRVEGGATTQVRIVNETSAAVGFGSGQPLTAVMVRPGSSQIIGVYTGAIAGTGLTVSLQPGEETSIQVLVSAASCDPSLGYVLPAGDYEVVVTIDHFTDQPVDGQGPPGRWVSDRLAIHLD